jgi:anhydro-N-acetylmuramic acid kinase
MSNYFIGVLSGTSMDGIDAALIDFENDHPHIIASSLYPIPDDIRSQCLKITQSNICTIDDLCILDSQVGTLFAEAINDLLKKTQVPFSKIKAIGSHGQTIRHSPHTNPPYTLQIGDPNIICERTGIATIADFRRRDMASGGQGAPLAPGFHASVFRDHKEDRVILNVGGISNITILPADRNKPILGFDTGPGNCLSDRWAQEYFDLPFDDAGKIARSGKVHASLLQHCLADPYFQKDPPKSTGREYFHLQWFEQHLEKAHLTIIPKKDLQATLLALSAHTIGDQILKYAPADARVLICGGGAHNAYLIELLEKQCKRTIDSTEAYGIPPDWVEAVLFAWLAKQTIEGKPGNCPSVTGAKHAAVLGGLYDYQIE